MQQHFRILGWIALVLSLVRMALLTVGAGVTYGLMSLMSSGDSPLFGKVSPLEIVSSPLTALALTGALMGMVAGAGLLKRRSWARPVAILAAVMALPGFPFWTALGVYGLWVMLSTEGKQAWSQYLQLTDSAAS